MISVSNKIHSDAKVLIISWSPVPTPKYQKIEGSGQRFFGLATGLQKNGIKDITIGIGNIYPLDVDEVSGFKLFNYDFNDEFVERLKQYDTIILNYAIHGAKFIAENLPPNVQVIYDVYGPAYIEGLARDPDDLVGTYIGNLLAVKEIFNEILPRGDFFLYANDAQEKFYTGVLASLGIINQFSYKTDRLLKVPFGIDKQATKVKYDNPYEEYGIEKDDFVLLWFGGLYPWFDITPILDTLKHFKGKTLKLVIVGGNNPQNQHPDFVKHYKNTVQYVKDNNLEGQVVLIDWVDFATRRKYYEYADLIVSMNGHGKENVYSWRTRVMDYVGSTTPLLTNGGDPLSDELIECGAAFKIDADDGDNIRTVIEGLASDQGRKELQTASNNMKVLQPKYYWENVTKILADKILAQARPYMDERAFKLQNNITALSTPSAHYEVESNRTLGKMTSILILKVREKGFRTTYRIVKDKVYRRAAVEYRKKFPKEVHKNPSIVFVSNQLNNTGAPFVLMDVIRSLKQKYPLLANNIRLIAFTPIEAANVIEMEKLGIKVEIHTNRELHIDFSQGDVVVFNTFAISRTTLFSAIHALNQKRLAKIFWYGHEASPDGFVDEDVKKIFHAYLDEDKAKIYSVSKKTREEYVKFFETDKNIEKMPFRFKFPEEKFKIRQPEDFNELRFITTGSLMDMRKGQYPILYAFLDFYHNHYVKSPTKYRKFHLSFIGAYEKSDLNPHAPYHIRNIKKQLEVSATGLGSHFSLLPGLSHKDAVDAISEANVTICYSLLEAMGIFVYEGMATGHPIIRNESAGQDEQLVDGKNGYAVSNDDFAGLVDTIEKILNKSTTTNTDLAKMSKVSNEIAKKATTNKYGLIKEIALVYKNKA